MLCLLMNIQKEPFSWITGSYHGECTVTTGRGGHTLRCAFGYLPLTKQQHRLKNWTSLVVDYKVNLFSKREIWNELGFSPSNYLFRVIKPILVAWSHKHGAEKPSACPQVKGKEIISTNYRKLCNQHRLLIALGSKYHRIHFQFEAFPN